MTAYYNENDMFASAWLAELMKDGLIPHGEIDTRSICDVKSSDLAGFTQLHFFAGIGGWAYALQLAGWGDRPVWTGSCPCQPFSAAGKQRGAADERHLWPEFQRLIAECSPPVVFGEQVASRLGREWLAGVRADLEALGYGVGCADLGAACVGAPHIRQRLYWVAQWLDDSTSARCDAAQQGTECEARDETRLCGPERGCSPDSRLGDDDDAGLERRRLFESECADKLTPWAASSLIPCADGKARRVKPGIFPLAHGVPNRVGLLRGAGNAIVPQIAAKFITAYMSAR